MFSFKSFNPSLSEGYNIFPKNFKPYVIGKIAKSSNKVRLNGKINWQK